MDESTCHLCSLPLRYGAVSHSVNDQPLRFCCQGCRMVYSMLLESAEVDDPAIHDISLWDKLEPGIHSGFGSTDTVDDNAQHGRVQRSENVHGSFGLLL